MSLRAAMRKPGTLYWPHQQRCYECAFETESKGEAVMHILDSGHRMLRGTRLRCLLGIHKKGGLGEMVVPVFGSEIKVRSEDCVYCGDRISPRFMPGVPHS